VYNSVVFLKGEKFFKNRWSNHWADKTKKPLSWDTAKDAKQYKIALPCGK